MPDEKIVVTLTRSEALELHDLMDWTNDPQFRDLAWRVMEAVNNAEDEDAKTNRTSTDDMQAPSAGSLPPTEQTER